MKIDYLVTEIGSTTTIVNAFSKEEPKFLGKGVSNTTVDTDVREGMQQALDNLKQALDVETLSYEEMFASSSAAGGLKMTVSGLVYEMTVRAAKEAALNAGANIHLVSAGKLTEDDLEQVKDINPNILLVAGGTDYGEKDTAYDNLVKLEQLKLHIPIIYAGNVDNHYRIKKYFKTSEQASLLSIVENVYPRVDYLNILPLRQKIYETFEAHIIHAKGMKHVKDMVNQAIMPTPGSVMESTMILSQELGNVMTIDVGGATTDIHSVSEASDEYKKYSEGQAKEKRTVEGDLGVYVNLKNVLQFMDKKAFMRNHDIDEDAFTDLIDNYNYVPRNDLEKALVYALTKICVFKALDRHVGDLKKVFTSSGQKYIPEGRDLSQVGLIVLTGGALIHLEDAEKIIEDYIKQNPEKLMPENKVKIVKDTHYIMSSIGVLSLKHKDVALDLLKQSLKI